ncbi:hypothetical protein [Dechloromonas sp. ZS-1]|uniref:hypothetical protein n=1 Tax=Dechloromonas sp. ZS-1 TaxID=3138067 RepID=UPI0031FCE713
MAALLVFEEHPDFASASRKAKELAVRFKTSTGIERSSEGWAVLVPQDVLTALTPVEDSDAEYEDYSDPYDDDYQREVVQALIEEFQEDQDSYARSEEDGWFYED